MFSRDCRRDYCCNVPLCGLRRICVLRALLVSYKLRHNSTTKRAIVAPLAPLYSATSGAFSDTNNSNLDFFSNFRNGRFSQLQSPFYYNTSRVYSFYALGIFYIT